MPLSAGTRGAALVLAAAFLWLGYAFAPPALAQADAPALWKISGPRGSVYLFGSFHLLPPDVKWRTPALLKALDDASSVVLETDLAGVQDPQAMQALVAKFGLLPDGKTLADAVGERTYAELQKTAAELKLPLASLSPLRPWLVAVTLAMQSIARMGLSLDLGVDLQVARWAAANGRALRSLETNESQLRALADLTPEQEIEFLAVTVRQIQDTPRLLNAMLTAYRKGDTAALERTVNAGLDEFPVLRRRLFKERHDKWLPQIEKMIAEGGTHVVVVGTGHLVGRDSVIAMLRAKGVRIEGP